MVYPYIVNRDGVWYQAGTEVPDGTPIVKEDKTKEDFSKFMNPPIEVRKSYTKTEINRMSTADLQTLATEQGIEDAEELSGSELKKVLIEKFEL